jgi:hypothetical protein
MCTRPSCIVFSNLMNLRHVPDLGGSFCDIWLVGAYVRMQASLIFINIQSWIVLCYSRLTWPKIFGADNTEQVNTNTMAGTVWMWRGAMWKCRNSHSSGSYDDGTPICGICWVCNQFTDGCKPITMSNVLMGECTAEYHKNLQQTIDPTK